MVKQIKSYGDVIVCCFAVGQLRDTSLYDTRDIFQKYDTLIDKALGIGNLHGQSQEKQLCPFYRELFVKLILLLRVHTKLEMVSIL